MEEHNQSDHHQSPLHVHRPAQESINPPKLDPESYREPVRADLSVLNQALPPYVLRNHPRLKELTGYKGRTLANLDCLGQGPSKRILLGNTVAYERESLIQWLESRSRVYCEEECL